MNGIIAILLLFCLGATGAPSLSACTADELVRMLKLRSDAAAREDEKLVVFVDESLLKPVAELASVFKKSEKGVTVSCEASTSKEAVRKVLDLGREADILILSDWTLVREYLMPQSTRNFINFAEDEMVLAYTVGSARYAEISQENWWKICLDKSVRFGIVEPNYDPAGYRSLLVLKLCDNWYGPWGLRRRLVKLLPYAVPAAILSGRAVLSDVMIQTWLATTKARPLSTLLMNAAERPFRRPGLGALLRLLEADGIDYALVYKSVAEQQRLPFLRLSPWINLGEGSFCNPSFFSQVERIYRQVRFRVPGRTPRRSILVFGQRVTYAAAIMNETRRPERAKRFIRLLLSPRGHDILRRYGLSPVKLETGVYRNLFETRKRATTPFSFRDSGSEQD